MSIAVSPPKGPPFNTINGLSGDDNFYFNIPRYYGAKEKLLLEAEDLYLSYLASNTNLH